MQLTLWMTTLTMKFIDGIECLLGFDPRNSTSFPPTAAGEDGDGVPSGYEILVFGTNPNAADTDGDRLHDGHEIYRYRSNPLTADTDGDGCSDAKEVASVNSDNAVNSIDLQQVAARFGAYPTSNRLRRNFDFTRNSSIQSADLGQVAQNFGPC